MQLTSFKMLTYILLAIVRSNDRKPQLIKKITKILIKHQDIHIKGRSYVIIHVHANTDTCFGGCLRPQIYSSRNLGRSSESVASSLSSYLNTKFNQFQE